MQKKTSIAIVEQFKLNKKVPVCFDKKICKAENIVLSVYRKSEKQRNYV